MKKQKAAKKKMLRAKEVVPLVGLSVATIYRLMDLDKFPRPYRVGLKAVRWDRQELKEWLKTRKRGIDKDWKEHTTIKWQKETAA